MFLACVKIWLTLNAFSRWRNAHISLKRDFKNGNIFQNTLHYTSISVLPGLFTVHQVFVC